MRERWHVGNRDSLGFAVFAPRYKEPHFFASDLHATIWHKDEQHYLDLFAPARPKHLAAGEEDRFKAILDAAPNMPFTASTSTWARQAQYLVDGDEAGFQEYTDYLDGGVDPADK